MLQTAYFFVQNGVKLGLRLEFGLTVATSYWRSSTIGLLLVC